VAYAPCGAQHKDAVQVTLEQIDLIKRFIEAYPKQLQLVKTAQGKIIFYIRVGYKKKTIEKTLKN